MKTPDRPATLSLLCLALAAPLACRGADPAPAPAPAPAAVAVTPDASAAERLHADVAWLADDARAGRRAGTQGERDAAVWIAARFEELGLEPAGEDGTWFQVFSVPLQPRDGGESSVAAGDGPAFEGAYVEPLSCSARGDVTARLVDAGYGIQNEELGRDDYAGLDAEGAVVLVRRGAPPAPADEGGEEDEGDEAAEGEEHAGPAWGESVTLFHKVMTARRQGAVAVVIVQAEDRAAEELPSFEDGRTARAGIPALMVRPQVGKVLERAETCRVVADVHRETGEARNVLARLAGRASDRTLVLGAHFDHLGVGGVGSLAPDEVGEIHNGADDNASGTAVVLELARRLAAGPAPEGDVVFALWSGEELGLLGSEHWAKQPTVPLEQVRANLNFDMVGRAGRGRLAVLGAGSTPLFAEVLEPAGTAAGLELDVNLSGQGVGGSDHQTFLRREVPALHFFSGVHRDYHRPSDDVERFEADGAARVTDLSLALVPALLAADELPFTAPQTDDEATPRPARWSVWFGTIPDYAAADRGLRLAGTSAGSPAERAGLLEGDVIVQVDDVEIDDIHAFMYVLQIHKPGDVVRTRYLRDGSEEEVLVTLGTRDRE